MPRRSNKLYYLVAGFLAFVAVGFTACFGRSVDDKISTSDESVNPSVPAVTDGWTPSY